MVELESLSVVKTSKSKFHSIEDHNFWICRNKVCPYCRSGSRAVPKAMIVEGVV